MSKDKREGWIRELKVGDKVVVSNKWSGSVVTIERITPSGIMSFRYFKDGPVQKVRPSGRVGSGGFNTVTLKPYTKAFELSQEAKKLTHKISRMMDRRTEIEFDLDDLNSIWEVLSKYEEKE